MVYDPPKAILFHPGEFQADCPFTMLKLIEKTFETHVSNCSETPSPLLGCERPSNHTLSSALDFYLYHFISSLRCSYKVFLIIFNPYFFPNFSQTYPSTPYYFSFMSSIFLMTCKVQFMLPIDFWVWSHPLEHSQLPGATLLEKTVSRSP